MVAGIQPRTVSCRIKQTIPATGRLMVKEVSQGRIKAINRRMDRTGV
jgi:hypothetical protein